MKNCQERLAVHEKITDNSFIIKNAKTLIWDNVIESFSLNNRKKLLTMETPITTSIRKQMIKIIIISWIVTVPISAMLVGVTRLGVDWLFTLI